MIPYSERLIEHIRRADSCGVVNIDPVFEKLPASIKQGQATHIDAIEQFCRGVVDAVCTHVGIVKFNIAYFEVLGADGISLYQRLIKYARQAQLFVIGDIKRGDVGHTATQYARAHLAGPDAADAVTINGYFGWDGVQPFAEVAAQHDRGVFVLVRTSNPDSSTFQLHGTPPLADTVAAAVTAWGSELVGERGYSSVGAVVGATHKEELADLRAKLPGVPLLLPGYGAQGAGAADVVPAFVNGLHGAVVNSSRGLLFAVRNERYSSLPWRDATRAALDDMIREFQEALGRS